MAHPAWSRKKPAQPASAPALPFTHSKVPLQPSQRLPNDEKAQAAEKQAEVEIQKLTVLLGKCGASPINPIERAILLTYIKAKILGLLEDG